MESACRDPLYQYFFAFLDCITIPTWKIEKRPTLARGWTRLYEGIPLDNTDVLKVWYNKLEYELIKLIWELIKVKLNINDNEMFSYFGLCYFNCNCHKYCSRETLRSLFNGQGVYGELMKNEIAMCRAK